LQELFGWHLGTEQFRINFRDNSLLTIESANARTPWSRSACARMPRSWLSCC